MRTYTITAEIEVKFRGSWLADGEYETAYPTVDVEYRYSAGQPAFTPRGEYGPIDPPDPPEVEFVGATLINGDGLNPTNEQLQDWARYWLDGEGFEFACTHAEECNRPDPDEAYERLRDNR